MQQLTILWSDTQRALISNEMEKLFALQDRPLSKDKKEILLDELSLLGFPAGAIVAGLRSLMAEDLKTIKLATIIAATRRFIVPDEIERTKCLMCGGPGGIFMRDPEKRSYALACLCPNGVELKRCEKLVTWNGKDEQFSNGRWLVAIFPNLIDLQNGWPDEKAS